MFASYPRIKSSLLKHALDTLPSTPTLCQEAIGYRGLYLFPLIHTYILYRTALLECNMETQTETEKACGWCTSCIGDDNCTCECHKEEEE